MEEATEETEKLKTGNGRTKDENMEAYHRKNRKASYAAEIISLARDLFGEYMSRENRISFLSEEALNQVIADCFQNAKAFVDESKKFFKNETNLRDH